MTTNQVITRDLPLGSYFKETERCALSLFSGSGGDTFGLESAGYKVTHFSEFNECAIRTHLEAFPTSMLLRGEERSTDIKRIPDSVFESLKGKIDLIFAGFPCQGFSHAGKKRSDDPRNELVHEFVRATNLIQPEWIIGENVRGLMSRKGVYPAGTDPRPVIDIIRDLFEGIGYRITYKVIDTIDVGVPQQRKRLIIVGHRGDVYPHLPWEMSEGRTGMDITIRNLLSSTLDGAVELPELYKPSEQPERFWIHTDEVEPTGKPHPNLVRLVGGIRNLSGKELAERGLTGKVTYVEPGGLISFGVRKGGYHGQVLDPDAPSKTIICAYNQCPRLFVGLYNPTVRKYWVRCLTPVECGQIQGFPVDYPWQGNVKDMITQIGNAVPPPLATQIIRWIENVKFQDKPQVCNGTNDNDDDEEE